MKTNVIMVLMVLLVSQLFCQEEQNNKDNKQIIPIIAYDTISFKDLTLHIPGFGVALMTGDMDERNVQEKDALMAVAMVKGHQFQEAPNRDLPSFFYNAEFILQKKKGKHQFFSLFQTFSDQPIIGGLHTFGFINGYGYEIIQNSHHSLYLGASLGISDWGIELSDGSSLPILPMPFLHYELTSKWLDCSFDFTTSPMMDLVIAPNQKLRLMGSLNIVNMELKKAQDIKFETALEYRLFKDDHPMGDFAGIKLGLLGEDFGYESGGDKENSLTLSWYEVYGTLDLSLLKITGGYTFSGQKIVGDELDVSLHEGFHLGIQLAYLF